MKPADWHFAQFPPVIILAAPRSGTKLLRNILANSVALSGPQYDINYVWMYGAYGQHTDYRPADAATARVREHIRRSLLRAANGRRLLEKTVSNGMRVDFVSAVLPEARFVHLVRDGRDVVGSLVDLWQLPASSSRNQSRAAIARKLWEYPWIQSSSYLCRTISERLSYRIGTRKIPPIWGPRYTGIEVDLAECSLADVCARQWLECEFPIEPALTSRPHIRIKYEDLIANPKTTIGELGDWLDLPDTRDLIEYARAVIKPKPDRPWSERLSHDEERRVNGMLETVLRSRGYLS